MASSRLLILKLRPSPLIYSSGTDVLQAMQTAPRRPTLPSGDLPARTTILNSIVGGLPCFTTGSIRVSLPFLVESANDRTSGIAQPHAGLGHFTVRAHSQAITVASPPPCS